MKTERIRDGFMPWSGLALGTTGWFFAHQLGSDSTFQDCRVGSPLVVTVAMVFGLLIIALGALGSWKVCGGTAESPGRRIVATVGLMACALFAMAVVLPFIDALLLPRCWQ